MSAADVVSIVIVTWKGDNLLRACLDSLARIYATAMQSGRSISETSSIRLRVTGAGGGRLVMLPMFACAAFVRSPRCLLRAVGIVAKGRRPE